MMVLTKLVISYLKNFVFFLKKSTDPVVQGDKPGYRAFDEGYKKDVFVKWPANIPQAQRTKPGNAPTDKGGKI